MIWCEFPFVLFMLVNYFVVLICGSDCVFVGFSVGCCLLLLFYSGFSFDGLLFWLVCRLVLGIFAGFLGGI